MMIRCSNSLGFRSAIGLQWVRNRGVRCSLKAPTVGTLQTLPAVEEDGRYAQVAKEAGFSLHTEVAAQPNERDKSERLYRYISRSAVSEKCLSLTSAGNIRSGVNGLTRVAGASIYVHKGDCDFERKGGTIE
jgi:hypothetical protein